MRTGGFAALALIALIVGATASASTEPIRTMEFVPGEVIVRFKPDLGIKTRQRILGTESATLGARLALPGANLVKLPAGESVSAAVSAFEQHPDVMYAQPNYVYHAAAITSDPFVELLWSLHNTGQAVEGVWGTDDADIDAPEAWNLTTGSDTVKVAVVDTGVEYDHADLAGNIVELGPDYYSGDLDPRDENGHGTHVAGTIGAQGNNGVGVSGVNWNVGLMPIRVLGPTGGGTSATIASGFAYAAEHGAKVVNASLGGRTFDPTLENTISAASGTLFVVAAGNGGPDRAGDHIDLFDQSLYPCSYASANVVCVAAADLSDGLAPFSNYGTTSVDLAAPGVRIVSTYVGGTYVLNQGTSMAAPHVAGVAALLLARNPAATVAQLREALLSSVDVLPAFVGKVATSGRLNAHKALLELPPAAPPAEKPGHRLTVARNGSGTGTARSTTAGINCGSDCVESFEAGTVVTLTANPASGSRFVAWAGACTGPASSCTVTMDAAKAVTATFSKIAVTRRPVRKVIKRVTLCHRGRTIKVLKSQVRKHRRHGDKLGPCRKPRRKRR